MIHYSLILHHHMVMKCAEGPFNVGVFCLPQMSFIMGTFSDPQNTHPGILYWSPSPPPPGGFQIPSEPAMGCTDT